MHFGRIAGGVQLGIKSLDGSYRLLAMLYLRSLIGLAGIF